MIGATPLGAFEIALTAVVGMVGISASVAGHFMTKTAVIDRLFFLAGGLLLIYPGLKTDLPGFCFLAAAIAIQWYRAVVTQK
jgi:TRAP-type uncharacterized transport system fused permease subunit